MIMKKFSFFVKLHLLSPYTLGWHNTKIITEAKKHSTNRIGEGKGTTIPAVPDLFLYKKEEIRTRANMPERDANCGFACPGDAGIV